jgi:Secretion system C-terminal sorting domain
MKRLSFFFFFVFLFSHLRSSATIRLIALADAGSPIVTLQWNMVNYPGNTAYILFKSIDGAVWETAAANPVYRRYTASTILAYRVHFVAGQEFYYRVKVYDTNENIVEISNTIKVGNPANDHLPEKSFRKKSIAMEVPVSSNGVAWQVYPNPVHDILNLIYRRNEIIKSAINITIQDATGKIVIRFRAASTNKQLHIPVHNLHTGVYFIRINVANELQMNDKFRKQ